MNILHTQFSTFELTIDDFEIKGYLSSNDVF